MDGSSSEIKISADIAQVLVEIGELERLRGALQQDFEGTFQQLEQQIPAEVTRIILRGIDEEGMSLGMCVQYVQGIVERILKERLQSNRPKLEILEKNLHTSLDKALISLESLRLIEKYLQDFCHKYPPQRILDWDNSSDNNDEYSEGDHEDYEIWKHDLGGDEGVLQEDVGKNEKMTLYRAIRAIQNYITHIDTLIPSGRCLHPGTAQRDIATEGARIKSMKRIIDRLRDMLDWGNNHAPYRALCAHGEPLGPNLFNELSADVIDTIKTWEGVCKRLNLNKEKN